MKINFKSEGKITFFRQIRAERISCQWKHTTRNVKSLRKKKNDTWKYRSVQRNGEHQNLHEDFTYIF